VKNSDNLCENCNGKGALTHHRIDPETCPSCAGTGIKSRPGLCGHKCESNITWIPVAQRLPDDDMTVLLALADGEVWTGFLDADQWRYVSADPIQEAVLFWAEFPAPPQV
jgi:hypothetical protein